MITSLHGGTFLLFWILSIHQNGYFNGVHPILMGSNFEIYKLFRHVPGVFDKGMFFGTNSFYIYI